MARTFKEADLAELVVNDAQELAKNIAISDELTKSQIRRFYHEYVTLRRSIRNDDDYKRYEVALKMIIPKVEYAANRKGSKLSSEFKQWLQKNLRSIKNSKDVHDFGDYFQAFLGYFYGAKPEKESQGRNFNNQNNWQRGGR